MRTRASNRKFSSLALLLVAPFCFLAHGQTPVDAIKARLIGQPLLLRGFWLDDDLHFDSAGKPLAHYKTGSFTESAFDARDVKLDGNHLTIQGQRVGLMFNNRGVERLPMRKPKMFSGAPEQITIVIDGQGNLDFSKELDAIFTSSVYEIVPSLPECWQPFARQHFLSPGTHKKHPDDLILPSGPDGSKPHAAAPPVMATAGIDLAGPQVSGSRQQGDVSGNVELYLWIGADGMPNSITIIRPVGLGLDEKAVDAVAHYHFKPAMFGRRTVATDVYLMVNFKAKS